MQLVEEITQHISHAKPVEWTRTIMNSNDYCSR